MLWSFSVGRLAGTSVRIHVTFLLFLGWFALDAYFRVSAAESLRTVLFVIAVFGCVVAHEFGHVLVARAFGIATPDITLYPFGGVARLNSLPQEPMQEFLVAIAGPTVNLAILAVLLALGATLASEALLQSETDFASRLALTNLVLAIFNLLPAFPMDGGRVLRAALSARLGFERATRLAAVVGHWLAVLLAVVGIFFNPMLIVIAVFIFFAATAELQAMEIRAFSKDVPVTRAMMTEFVTLPIRAALGDAVEVLLHSGQKAIPVLDDNRRLAGIVEIGDVVRELHTNPAKPRPIADLLVGDVPMLTERSTLEQAFQLLRETLRPALAVVDANENLVGLITLETLSEMLMLHEASPSVFEGLQSARNGATPISRQAETRFSGVRQAI
jgi:Zn-dependent protease/CBS domain-containing protein